MEKEDPLSGPMQISQEDIALVDTYRKLKNTSVLTIMFTDIKGFTQLAEEKGEVYSNTVRKLHDEILTNAIEEEGEGKVVKHIGDAIMAVFSEPSAAVKKALAIQENIRVFNQENDDIEDILVRIGLHMGQVTTENEVDLDVFGRHVNRASRVEGLADGGHIYLTYSVFDSAKGWLAAKENPDTSWKQHGRYYVKGIDKPIEIYEVFNNKHSRSKSPSGAKKKRNIPTLVVSILLVLAGAVGVLFLMQIQKTSVVFINLFPEKVFVDHETRLIVDGDKKQRMRNALTRIPPGRHVLHYDVSYLVRYYAEIMVKRGENYIEAKFTYNGLPALCRRVTFSKDGKNRVEASKTEKYIVYNKKNNKKHEATVDLNLSIEVKPDPLDEEKLVFTYTWKIVLDGKEINRDSITRTQVPSNPDTVREEIILHEDDYHYYSARFYISRYSSQLEIGAGYIEYKE